jgi:hypothetical protein
VNADTGNPNPDEVDFQFRENGGITLLRSELPAITHPIFINGSSFRSPFGKGGGQVDIGVDGLADGLRIDASHTTIQDLKFVDCSHAGIDVASGVSDVEFKTNVFEDNSVGIHISGGDSNIQFLNNKFLAFDTSASSSGIDISTDCSNVTFFRNLIWSNQAACVTIASGGSNLSFFENKFQTTFEGGGASSLVNLSGGGSNIYFDRDTFAGVAVVGLDLSGGGSNITLTGVHFNLWGGQTDFVLGGSATGTSATISNCLFTSFRAARLGGTMTGLLLDSMNNSSSVVVQDTRFGSGTPDVRDLRVGVSIRGDGTTAGTIDLGGGLLGSDGANNFLGFGTATANSYAIGLFNVSPSFTVFAENESIGIDPTTIIADGTHDTAAGGSGVIAVSS